MRSVCDMQCALVFRVMMSLEVGFSCAYRRAPADAAEADVAMQAATSTAIAAIAISVYEQAQWHFMGVHARKVHDALRN